MCENVLTFADVMVEKKKSKHAAGLFTLVLMLAIFLFWWKTFPQALSFQEQYQLFLWSGDYLMQRLAVPGGLADWMGEFVVQFYLVEWLGAALLAMLYAALALLSWRVLCRMAADGGDVCLMPWGWVVPLMTLWMMGDENVLLSHPMAMLVAMAAFLLLAPRRHDSWKRTMLICIPVLPVLYWLIGPLAWLTVLLVMVRCGWKLWNVVPWMLAIQLFAYHFFLSQWPLHDVFLGHNYYRLPMQTPTLLWVIPLTMVAMALVVRLLFRSPGRIVRMSVGAMGLVAIALLAVIALTTGYDSDKYELLAQDRLIRQERWDEIVDRAMDKEVRTPFWCNSVNLALAQKRWLADRMFDFWQCGPDALFTPMRRDMVSDLPTAEAFWRLGLVNSAQRYMADMQESILNARKSGRMTKRIAECYLVNGKFDLARKHLRLLEKSLFYRQWAREAMHYGDKQVEAHPVYGKLRRMRLKQDFLFSPTEMDKILGILFMGCKDNKMALDYCLAQLLLNGDVMSFQQMLPMAQQHGGYAAMPLGYQDAVRCITSRGGTQGSPYADYVRRMTTNNQPANNTSTYETAH